MERKNALRSVDVSRRPGDVATDEGDLTFSTRNDVTVSGYTGYDGGATNATAAAYTNDSGEKKFLMKTTGQVEGHLPGVQVGWRIRDLDGPTDLAYFYGRSHDFDPAVRIEDNWRVDYFVNNPLPHGVTVDLAVSLRDEVTD